MQPPDTSISGAGLRLIDLVKRYGGTEAVCGISLDVQPGEFVTFLGPSGSGKTTTLNMVAGFIQVDAGAIQIDGRPIEGLPPHRRDIGMVFQHYALFPHMTAAQNVAFPLRQRKVPKGEIGRRVEAALEQVRLSRYGDRYPAQLSGGQQQRVALARALVFSPRVLLMDEPLGALDKQLREELQLELKRLHREVRSTFVYVTHDQEEALVLSDRIAVFNDGRVEQVGTPKELYEQPRSLFVAQFLGQSNRFMGEASRNGELVELRCGERVFHCTPERAGVEEGPAVLIVRPEDVQLGSAPAGSMDANEVGAVVDQVVYLGSVRKLVIQFDTGDVGLVMEADTDSDVREGERVPVWWRIEDGLVLGCGIPAPARPVQLQGR
jgi:putative spermidine/putrescine transport system ATP-binding protein